MIRRYEQSKWSELSFAGHLDRSKKNPAGIVARTRLPWPAGPVGCELRPTKLVATVQPDQTQGPTPTQKFALCAARDGGLGSNNNRAV
jgi:hypothetical protein